MIDQTTFFTGMLLGIVWFSFGMTVLASLGDGKKSTMTPKDYLARFGIGGMVIIFTIFGVLWPAFAMVLIRRNK